MSCLYITPTILAEVGVANFGPPLQSFQKTAVILWEKSFSRKTLAGKYSGFISAIFGISFGAEKWPDQAVERIKSGSTRFCRRVGSGSAA
jgi:hypothetical protein